MDITSNNFFELIIIFTLGATFGFVMAKTFFISNSNKELEEQFENTKNEFNEYREEVHRHFQTTADLVNKMTESYQEVHQHLSDGAKNVAQYEINSTAIEPGISFKQLSDLTNDEDNIEELDNKSVEPPKDYALKKSNQVGTLSEDFGFKDFQNEDESTETISKD